MASEKKNPFMGMTVAQMKKYYDSKVRGKGLKAKELKVIANQMQAAKKAAPKAKTNTPKPRQTTKSEAASRFYSSSSGTRGELRPSNPPSPTVTRKGSDTGASVDPRERQLRKNRQDAKRGSTTKGRANIKAQVDAVSGSGRRNQRQVEERRRRARRRAMLKNRRQLLSRRHNDM
tara:strand:- start:36 stop:560 length:525 start_codon:yes stop_codon:yes gene_type:complete